jgi:hypothetical protein
MAESARGRPRLFLLLAVLAGLFLMHGMSAASASGCHGGTLPMSVSPMSVSPMSLSPMAMPMTAPMTTQHPDHLAAAGDSRDSPAWQSSPHLHEAVTAAGTCVPLRPDDTAGLVVVLMLVALSLWRAADLRDSFLSRGLRRSSHGPPRRCADLLTDLGVCRT